ncbi:MAG: glycosyltransferase family 39 protein [Candidatus Glassbacteria bacterium]|nr:glycosyltransferase family 39 protein [Candidatus Glassbacteria bacterium]
MSAVRRAEGEGARETGASKTGVTVPLAAAVLAAAAALGLRLAFLDDPIRYDEAYTYLNYATLPVFEALSQYTSPNNQLLHTLLVKLSTTVFDPWQEWSVRLPALVSGVLLTAAVFVFALRQRGLQAGLWAAALTAASSYLVEYSVLGRGYTMVCLFTVLVLAACGTVARQPGSKGGWALFICSSVAGLVTIPVMLYPLCVATAWILLGADLPEPAKPKALVKPLVLSWAAILAGTALCYAPALISTGPQAVLANRFVRSLPLTAWADRLPGLVQTLFTFFHRDLPLAMTLLLAAGFLLGCFKTPRLVLASALCVPGLLLTQRVVPEPRVFTFLLVIYLYVAALGLNELSRVLLRGLGYKRSAAAVAVFCLAWLGAASFFLLERRGPSHSYEIGIFPEAERVADFLSSKLTGQEVVWLWNPSETQVKYYAIPRGVGLEKFALRNPGDDLPPGIYNVLNLRFDSLATTFGTYVCYDYPKTVQKIDSALIRYYTLKPQAPYIEEAWHYLDDGKPEKVPGVYVRMRKEGVELTDEERYVLRDKMAELKDLYNSTITREPGNADALLIFACYHTLKQDSVMTDNVYRHILKYTFSAEQWLRFIEFASVSGQAGYAGAMLDRARRQHPHNPLFREDRDSTAAAP